jgi:hypothetical protein
MARTVFTLSDFVLSLFLLFGGLNLSLPSGDFQITSLAAGIGLALLGVLVFVFSSRAAAKGSGLYVPRILVYSVLFVVLIGAFIHRWFRDSGALEKGDWYPFAIGGTFLACNAIGYAFWGRRKTNGKSPDV